MYLFIYIYIYIYIIFIYIYKISWQKRKHWRVVVLMENLLQLHHTVCGVTDQI